jgi:hypothetical protein
MPKGESMNKTEMIAKATTLQKQIDKGQIKGKVTVRRAKKYINHLNWMVKQPKTKLKAKRSVKKNSFNPDQGFLLNFLPQQSLVRIEELVADKMFKQLNNVDTKSIEKSLSKAFKSKRVQSVLKKIDRENKKRKSA